MTNPPSWKLHRAIALALLLGLIDRIASCFLDVDRIFAATAGEETWLIFRAIGG